MTDISSLHDPRRSTMLWRAALAGIAGPIVFAVTLAALDVAQLGFLTSIGQDPRVSNPISINALGPYGWGQTLNFALFGILLLAWSAGLHAATADGRRWNPGPRLMTAFGMAIQASACTMDAPGAPRSWHGTVHGLAFPLVMLTVVLGVWLTWARIRRDGRWVGLGGWTLAAALVITSQIVVIFLPEPQIVREWPSAGAWLGPAGRLQLGVLFAWMMATGVRMARLARAADESAAAPARPGLRRAA